MTAQATSANMPVVLLKDGASQTKGREAQKNNISAAKIIAEIVHTSLGPRGMDKMLVDSLGDVTITNDGATILKEIDVQHPAAKMLVEVSKTTDNEVGDGTTSVVVLAGALLEQAESLLLQDVHPTIIVDGYKKAANQVKQYLKDLAEQVFADDKPTLLKIAKTSMQTKLVRKDSDNLADLVVRAVLAAAVKDGDNYTCDLDDIKVEKKSGGSISESSILEGIVLDKEVVHSGMPKKLTDTKIALINTALEIEKTETDAKINISNPEQLKSFLNEENTIAYCGSLIQQNHGESIGHGYLLWDVPKRKSRYIEIPNNYGYYTLDVDNGKVPDVDNLPKKARLRVRISNTDAVQLKKVLTIIYKKYGIKEVVVNRTVSLIVVGGMIGIIILGIFPSLVLEVAEIAVMSIVNI